MRGAKRRELARALPKYSEDDAEHYFATSRFGMDGQQTCPKCGTVANHYRINSRRKCDLAPEFRTP